MKNHNCTSTPAPAACQPDNVRDTRLHIPETEAMRPFDRNGSTAHHAVDKPCSGPMAYTEEMLKLMLSDCRRSMATCKAELEEIEPTRVMLTEEIKRTQVLEQGILSLIAAVNPDLQSELEETHEAKHDGYCGGYGKTSVLSLLAARVRARQNGDLD